MPMRADPPNDRLLPGHYEPSLRPVDPGEPSGMVSFRQALTVVRRRFQLILGITAVGAALGLFLASQEPTSYKASAMLRLAGERQTLTGGTDESPNLGRTADPMMSIIELMRSRTVVGVVVDSLGLQLVSLTPEFSVEDLSATRVDPARGRRLGVRRLPRRRSERPSRRTRGQRAVRPDGQPRRGSVPGAVASVGGERHPRHPVPRSGDRRDSSPSCW